MSGTNLYERIVTHDDVEDAVAASLNVWINDYLGEMERLKGYDPGQIERPRGIVTSSEFDNWPEDQLPVIIVVNAGLDGAPVRRAEGTYEAAWLVGISPVVSDVDQAATRKLAGTYIAACRAALAQHKRLKSPLHPEGFASFSHWRDERYTDIPFDDSRTLGSGVVVFSIGVDNVTTEQAGPREPSPEPEVDPGPLPNVTEVDVTVHPEPIA